MNCVGSQSISTFNNTVLYITVISYMNIIKNYRILNNTIIAYIYFLKQYRILNSTIDYTTTRHKTVIYNSLSVILSRWKILNL